MIKSITLFCFLSFGIVSFAHAQGRTYSSTNKPSVSKKDKNKKDNKKDKKDDDVVYLDMSTSGSDDESSMPSITPKGKL